jgi:beta-phosphoglucomutase
MSTRAVLFDLDGVLVRTDEFHFRAWKFVADEEGLRFDRAINERLRGVSRMDGLAAVLEANAVVMSDVERVALAERKNERFLSLLEGVDGSAVCEGVGALLTGLSAREVPMAVASSSRNARVILERTGLAGAFACVVDGNDIDKAKPDPEVFLRAAAGLSTTPEGCVVVEDARAGVEAALAAGMRVVGVGGDKDVGRAHRVVGSLVEIDAGLLVEV